MNIKFELQEKSFTTPEGKTLPYYVLSHTLVDGSVLEVSIKGDKAKLLLMSLKMAQSQQGK